MKIFYEKILLKSILLLVLYKSSGLVNGKSVSGFKFNSRNNSRMRKNTRID